MCDPESENAERLRRGVVETLPPTMTSCKFYWFSKKESEFFRKENADKTHKGDRLAQMTIEGSLFTQCTPTKKEPANRFQDYVFVRESMNKPEMGESW